MYLPIVPMWDLGPSFVYDPSPASRDPRRKGSRLWSVSSDRYFREKQFTVDVEPWKYGEHRAQKQCTNVTPHSAKFVISTRSRSHDIVRDFFNNSECARCGDALPVVTSENKINRPIQFRPLVATQRSNAVPFYCIVLFLPLLLDQHSSTIIWQSTGLSKLAQFTE